MMNVNDIFRDLNQQISQQGEIMGKIWIISYDLNTDRTFT